MGEWKDEREQIVKMEEEFKNLSDRNVGLKFESLDAVAYTTVHSPFKILQSSRNFDQ